MSASRSFASTNNAGPFVGSGLTRIPQNVLQRSSPDFSFIVGGDRATCLREGWYLIMANLQTRLYSVQGTVYSEIMVNNANVRATRCNVMYYAGGNQQSASCCACVAYLKVGDTVANTVGKTSAGTVGLNEDSGLSLTLRIMRLTKP